MSNLLKSKILLGALIVVVMVVGVFALTTTVKAADCTLTSTLRQGSTGEQVECLQTKLGATVDGKFGPMTKAKVMAFQTDHQLTADGVVGALTRAALAGVTTTTGCENGALFNAQTGASCTVSTVPGCTAGALFSSTTGASCTATTTLPAGCTSTAGFSPTTGASCSTGITTSGAGSLSTTVTTADVESSAPEGLTTHVVAFKGQASGSDISVDSIGVTLQNTTPHATSTRLDHYAGVVSIYMGSTKVGSVNVSDFTKNGTVYSANIPLTGALVKVGSLNRQTFYVDVTALTNIDTGDATSVVGTDNFWTAEVNEVRYTDGTGLTLSRDPHATVTHVFTFTKLVNSGDLKLVVAKASGSPIAQNVEVSDTGSTSGILLNKFTMKPTGADMTMTSLTVNTNAVTSTGGGDAADMIQNLILKADGVQVAEIDTVAGGNNAGLTANAFTLDNDLVMKAGSTVTFEVFAKVNTIGVATFAQGDSFLASYSTASVETTTGGSSVTTLITGSSAGNAQTFYSSGVSASNFTSSYTTVTDSGTVKKQTYSISFKLAAFGDTYYIPKTLAQNVAAGGALYIGATEANALIGSTGLGFNVYKTTGVLATAAEIVAAPSSMTSSDADTVGTYFEIPAGETRTFNVTIELTAGTTPGYYHLQLGQVLYDLDQTANNNGVATTAAHLYTFAPAQNFQTADSKMD